jgi:glycosyltransferase involved in cell wall biosynthesis
MRRVLFCGTHPEQFNGYSKVVFELCNELSKFEDIKIFIYGFQNFYKDIEHARERKLSENVEIYDAWLHEKPKNKGFGENEFLNYVKETSPDIVIIYNDLVVISTLMKLLNEIPERQFKIIPYIDLVYKNENNNILRAINDNCDGAIAFSHHWKNVLINEDFNKPLWVLEHGFNKSQYFPIPKIIARKYFEISPDSFIILNLNRNQPRKRWDHCLMAYIKFISNHLDDNIKLLVLTSLSGGWNLADIMKSEAKKYNLTLENIKRFFIFIENPQKLSDYDINIMYNVADIGFNTCDGEGFGLCNFEQAAVGVPQIIPHVGGFLDFFDENNSIPIKPKMSIHYDNSKDGVGGEAELCMCDDYVDALEKYYNNRELIQIHGENARNRIIQNYEWKKKAAHLKEIIQESTKDLFPEAEIDILSQINEYITIKDTIEDTNIDTIKDTIEDTNIDTNIDIEKMIEERINENNSKTINEIESSKKQEPQLVITNNEFINSVETMSVDDLFILQTRIKNILSKNN